MKIRGVALTNWPQVLSVFDAGIKRSALFTQLECAKNSETPEEPDYIYGLFREGVSDWAAGLSYLFAPAACIVRIGGVFCHQSPKVHWIGMSGSGKSYKKGKPSIEIGDLLVVVRYTEPGHTWSNALLLQSKRQNLFAPLPTGDQYNLYAGWPGFDYVAKTMALLGSRQVTGGAHRGAQFHIIDESYFPSYPSANASATATSPSVITDLSSCLGGLLTGASGRAIPYQRPNPSGTDWGQVVWDLLDVTAQGTLNREAMSAKEQPRGNLCFLCGDWAPELIKYISGTGSGEFLPTVLAFDELPPPPRKKDLEEEDDEAAGISLILIDIAANE